MTPQQFISKWKSSTRPERAAAQEHFLDLCRLIDHPTPAAADPTGDWFAFEKGASKTGGGEGWADVWKKGYFAWEYKGKHKDLNKAFAQLQRYAIALENPPLLVVSDMETIIIHTNWTNTVQEVHTLAIEDLDKPEAQQKLKWLFTEPDRFKPGITREIITEQAAQAFASLAQRLRDQGYANKRVAHYINKLLFCMFAEDIGILPGKLFTRLLESVENRPEKFFEKIKMLFSAMKDGGDFGVDEVPWFNGGLFDDDDALPLDKEGVQLTLKAAKLDWSDIEPSIFGTLFERGLDPSKRSQLGAHYTDRQSIMRIISPVIIEPLLVEWEAIKQEIIPLIAKKTAPSRKKADALYHQFLERLKNVRILDPACGSGNFLYLALLELKNLEHRVMLEAEVLGFHRSFFQVGPRNVLGIEINEYAAELARVTIWIGEIQWMLHNGFGYSKSPVLEKLEQIECRDAILNSDGKEARWPRADFIVGNPPFLGGSKMLGELGEEYVKKLRAAYTGKVPGGADLVTYWFEKARAEITAKRSQRAGLVATNSIRGGANREVLKRICGSGRIYCAWSDEPWINDGAAVRVSLVCFETKRESLFPAILNDAKVSDIYPDLTGAIEGACLRGSDDFTKAKPIEENKGISFQGSQKIGPFDIPGELAREWLAMPCNPSGKPNSDVIKESWNGIDLTRRRRDVWIIDFGTDISEADAALYEAPFEYVLQHVKPERANNNREAYRKYWWRHGEPRVGMRAALKGLRRYIATPEVTKHRVFAWLSNQILPDKKLIVFALEDDTSFGILHSRIHEIWSLKLCSWHGAGNDPRYTPTTCFETFPFPEGLRPNNSHNETVIAEAAQRLVELRDNWLNPTGASEAELKKRTLTNLYNARPTWLSNAHATLDAAVAAAYGWDADIPDDEVLRELLKLNHERANS